MFAYVSTDNSTAVMMNTEEPKKFHSKTPKTWWKNHMKAVKEVTGMNSSQWRAYVKRDVERLRNKKNSGWPKKEVM